MKKLLVYISLVMFVFILMSVHVFALVIDYYPETDTVGFDAEVTKATTTTKYKVIGFTVSYQNYSTMVKLDPFDDIDNPDGTTVTVPIRIPCRVGTNSIMQRFKDKYGDADWIKTLFSKDNTLTFNGIMTITEGNDSHDLATMNSNGTFTSHKGGLAELDSEYFTTSATIKRARWWKRRDDIDTFFNRTCRIEGKHITVAPPTAIISKGNTIIADGGKVSYLGNETVNLSGINSNFPKYAETKYYKWDYKPFGTQTWTNISNAPGKVIQTFPKLAAGNYDVKFTVWYSIGTIQYIDKADSTQIVLNITPSPEGAYVTVVPSTHGDIKVTQAQIDAKTLISVAIDAEAFLNDYNDASKVTQCKINARLDPAGSGDQLQSVTITNNVGFTQSVAITFLLPAGVYTQKFAVSASFTIPGKIVYSKTEYCAVNLYKDAPPLPQNPVPQNKLPVAVISAPSKVKAGDTVFISGSGSYDPDGTIDQYIWNTEGAAETLTSSVGYVSYPTAGEYKISLAVIDNNGAAGYDQKTIKAEPPTPSASFSVTGKLKEKRIVYLSDKSTSPAKFPLSNTRTTWTVTPVIGSGAAADAIRKVVKISTVKENILVDPYTSSSLNGLSVPAIMFGLAGQYDITLTVANSAGLSDSSTQRVTIEQDQKPVVKFTSEPVFYRETIVNDVNYGKLTVNDESYSPDGDFISYRKIYAIYDANNNGMFGDSVDQTIVIDESSDISHINTVKSFEYLTKEVGKYEIHVMITESYNP